MKHIFVINPVAGKKSCEAQVREYLQDKTFDYEIYLTKAIGDAHQFVKDFLENYDEEVTFYACGGDGTLNEVANAVAYHDNARVACYAVGTGNDFVKYFADPKDFTDIDKLVNGTTKKIDMMMFDNRLCLNIANFGFDANAAYKMNVFKRWPLVTGSMAYNLGVLHSVIFKMRHHIKLTVDDELIFDGIGTLCSIANGCCYGGGYKCAPRAVIDDGLLDVCMVRKISRFKLAGMIKAYKLGQHLDDPRFEKYIIYLTGKKIKVESKKPIIYSNDGEISKSTELNLEVLPQILNFVIPE